VEAGWGYRLRGYTGLCWVYIHPSVVPTVFHIALHNLSGPMLLFWWKFLYRLTSVRAWGTVALTVATGTRDVPRDVRMLGCGTYSSISLYSNYAIHWSVKMNSTAWFRKKLACTIYFKIQNKWFQCIDSFPGDRNSSNFSRHFQHLSSLSFLPNDI